MVDHSNIRTGIDPTGSHYLTAQVEKNVLGMRVFALSRIGRGELSRSLLSDNNFIVLSLSDDSVLSKNIVLPQKYSGTYEKVIRFEIEHSLLDNSDEICFDFVDTGDKSQVLAQTTHRQTLERISELIQSNESEFVRIDGFVARSIALGRGFIQYCSNDTERLVCLVDFARERVALCLVLGNSIVASGSFDRKPFVPESDNDFSRITTELKTILNFKLNDLASRGINVELSRIIICNSFLNANQKQDIARRLGVQLEEPVFDRLLLDQPVLDSHLPVSDFLVSLGLTVE